MLNYVHFHYFAVVLECLQSPHLWRGKKTTTKKTTSTLSKYKIKHRTIYLWFINCLEIHFHLCFVTQHPLKKNKTKKRLSLLCLDKQLRTLTTTLKSSRFLNLERCSCSFGSMGCFFILEYFKKAQNFSSPYSWPAGGGEKSTVQI